MVVKRLSSTETRIRLVICVHQVGGRGQYAVEKHNQAYLISNTIVRWRICRRLGQPDAYEANNVLRDPVMPTGSIFPCVKLRLAVSADCHRHTG